MRELSGERERERVDGYILDFDSTQSELYELAVNVSAQGFTTYV